MGARLLSLAPLSMEHGPGSGGGAFSFSHAAHRPLPWQTLQSSQELAAAVSKGDQCPHRPSHAAHSPSLQNPQVVFNFSLFFLGSLPDLAKFGKAPTEDARTEAHPAFRAGRRTWLLLAVDVTTTLNSLESAVWMGATTGHAAAEMRLATAPGAESKSDGFCF